MNGQGLIKGLGVTIKHFFAPKITELYPEVKPNLPPAVKASFEINREKCIACGLCAKACPNQVITMKTVKDENNKRQLAGYEMNMQYCLFCGLCAESCPTGAIIVKQDFELAAYTREDTKKQLYFAGSESSADKESSGAKE
ncbi:MAG: NuoI/complex I 23 kDa subunit family protein [Bacillota bacterium]|jgi:NADH-quinone oxidoreductase subunit I